MAKSDRFDNLPDDQKKAVDWCANADHTRAWEEYNNTKNGKPPITLQQFKDERREFALADSNNLKRCMRRYEERFQAVIEKTGTQDPAGLRKVLKEVIDEVDRGFSAEKVKYLERELNRPVTINKPEIRSRFS